MSTPKSPVPHTRRPVAPVEMTDVDDQFDECDVDGDERIDFTEFSALLDRLGSEVPVRMRRRRFNDIDVNRDGRIDRREFFEWLERA